MARLKTSFPKSIAPLIALARHVKTCMSSNANFTLITEAFAAALVKLSEDIEKLQKAQDDAAFGGTQKTSYRDQAAAELVATLRNVIRHVELFANGNVSILRSSGFELVDPLEKKWKIPVDLPQLLVSVAPGQETGTLVAKAQSIPYALSYEAHITQGDPALQESWNHFGFYKKPTMHMSGFASGQNYHLRFRLICSKGEGPWSPTHTFTSP